MRMTRRRRNGGGGPPSRLPSLDTHLRLLPPLVLPLAAAAVVFVFSWSILPDTLVFRRPGASPTYVASSEQPMRPTPSISREPPQSKVPILCKGSGNKKMMMNRVGDGGGGRGDTITVAPPDGGGPYHDWELFRANFEEMMGTFKIFAYPDVHDAFSPFASVFLPRSNPSNPKLGNYYSEHMFKHALLRSPLLTPDAGKAHLFFMPFSINVLRNDPRVWSEAAIADFVAGYANRVRRELGFWNASGGVDHFYVSCHSVGRDAAARHHELRDNAVHVSCSSSYFQRNYIPHKDVALPQVWPRPPERSVNPPSARKRLVFFAGRIQNSQVRTEMVSKWENDSTLDIFSKNPPFPYEEGFRRSKYCLHVKGYEVNTARISDAIHYGCVPVILSNYYDLPFADVLNWSKFSVILNHRDIGLLKEILLSIPNDMYSTMYQNLLEVRKHFRWHMTPKVHDSFYMTIYQLWLRRLSHLGFVS